MKKKHIATGAGILITAVAMGSASLHQWYAHQPQVELALRLPDQSGPESRRGTTAEKIRNPQGIFLAFAGHAADLPGYWPGFRGADHQNIVHDSPPLANHWEADGPPELWAIDDLGEGHGGPAIMNGRVYILDYDEEKQGDALRCFSLADGQEIWRRWYKIQVKRNHGISRSVPGLTDDRVITMGPKGHVLCVDAASGEFNWALDLGNRYNAEIPTWYTAQCPLIDDNKVILAPAGDALMIAVDCITGDVVWETPNPRGWKMSHSSIIPMRFQGEDTYVYCALGGIVGVSATDGRILWESEAWKSSVVAPSPLQLDEDRLFVTAGYGAGSMIFQVSKVNDRFELTEVATVSKKVFASEQQTPVLYQDHLFSIMPNDGGGLKKQLVCYHPENGMAWASGSSNRFGLGPYLIADDKLFVLRDDGLLTMVRASTEGYEELGHAQILDGHDAWGPMALVNGLLLLRDSTRMICLDLRTP